LSPPGEDGEIVSQLQVAVNRVQKLTYLGGCQRKNEKNWGLTKCAPGDIIVGRITASCLTQFAAKQ